MNSLAELITNVTWNFNLVSHGIPHSPGFPLFIEKILFALFSFPTSIRGKYTRRRRENYRCEANFDQVRSSRKRV